MDHQYLQVDCELDLDSHVGLLMLVIFPMWFFMLEHVNIINLLQEKIMQDGLHKIMQDGHNILDARY